MMPEFGQFLAFFLITVALLKIGASFANRNGGNAIGNGLSWFVPA